MTHSRQFSSIAAAAMAAIAALLLLPATAAAQADRQIIKIGYVSTERIMREARAPAQLQKSLEAEFQKRDREISAAKAPDMDRRRAALVEEMTQRRDDAVRQFVEKANAAIKRVGERDGFDAVFIEAAFADKRIDITEQVIKALDAER